jgi:uncharacterized protein (TIGR02147 family)
LALQSYTNHNLGNFYTERWLATLFVPILPQAVAFCVISMPMEQTYYVTKLKERLSEKQRTKPQYSLRAFARDIDVHASTLSQVLKGKRALPFKSAHTVAGNLSLSPKERTLFLESIFRAKTNIDEIKISELDKIIMHDETYHKGIAEWEHYAVLELFDLANFEVNKKSIASKLDLTPTRVEVVLTNLLQCGLLKNGQNDNYEKAHPDIKTTEDVASNALKESHKETLNMGLNKLDEIEVELRDFSSSTIGIDLEKLPEAKTIIREFRQKMTGLLRDGNKTDVYQLAIQFYPLTKMEKK